MPPVLGHECRYSFDDKTTFPGVKAILTHPVHADLFVCLFVCFWKPDPLMFFVVTRYKAV